MGDINIQRLTICCYSGVPGLSMSVPARLREVQATVVQRRDNAIHRINRYPVDKC